MHFTQDRNMDLSWLFEPARIKFCEETLSGVIKHPADTWTNIGPFVAGVITLIIAKRPLERLLGVAALWTGVASAYFHASNTILRETLDLSGMFMFILSLAALQQHRATAKAISCLAGKQQHDRHHPALGHFCRPGCIKSD